MPWQSLGPSRARGFCCSAAAVMGLWRISSYPNPESLSKDQVSSLIILVNRCQYPQPLIQDDRATIGKRNVIPYPSHDHPSSFHLYPPIQQKAGQMHSPYLEFPPILFCLLSSIRISKSRSCFSTSSFLDVRFCRVSRRPTMCSSMVVSRVFWPFYITK